MAGMLPGVESARRRRFHNSNLNNYGASEQISPSTSVNSTRRSSFCLYTSSYEFHSSSSTRSQMRHQQGLCDESRLSAAAREAKKRLDERLQPQWRSETKRTEFIRYPSNQQISRSLANSRTIQLDLQGEVMPKLKKIGSKRLNWLKLSWKSSEQDECAVCLEHFKAGLGGTLMQLPCGHRFHTNCLMPWLEGNGHCPCCRMEIPS